LLPQLVAVDVLDWEKYSRVKDSKNVYDKIDMLLEYCNPESGTCWERFLESLKKTHQNHVVNYVGNPGREYYLFAHCQLPTLLTQHVTADVVTDPRRVYAP